MGNTYYLANREKILKRSKEYYRENKKQIIPKQKRYYLENREIYKIYSLKNYWSPDRLRNYNSKRNAIKITSVLKVQNKIQ